MQLIPDDDPRLHEKCSPINLKNPGFELEATVREMFNLMHSLDGLGLAAPQVGLTKRLFVMSLNGIHYVCINPLVLNRNTKLDLGQEGCLSFPGLYLRVQRPTTLKAEYRDIAGKTRRHELIGLLARCFAHELDHLDGIVFTERQAS